MKRLQTPPIVEVLTLDEALKIVATLRDSVVEQREEYERVWRLLDERRQTLLREMSGEDLTQVELLRVED